MTGPLTGLLVADFSRVLAGPYATMMLADLGAEVIKVEAPGGDDTRGWKPPIRDGVSTYFLAVNRNKRSVVLDLTVEQDLVAARELALRADILVQNFRPGGLVRFGLDQATVSAINPGVIYASISGFGSGRGADLPGYDLMVQAVSGLMSLTGDPAGPAYRAGISAIDVITGLHAVIGILAALRQRSLSGTGQHVQVDLLSSALSGMVNQTSAFVAANEVPYRMGNAHPSIFPYDPLAARDGEMIVIAVNDRQFANLCAVLGIPELASDPRFAHNQDRTAHRAQLKPILEQQLGRRDRAEWFQLLQASGVACAPINTVAEGVAFAESLGLEPVMRIGGVPAIRNPIGLSASGLEYDRPPPDLDQDGEQIRRWLAGPRDQPI